MKWFELDRKQKCLVAWMILICCAAVLYAVVSTLVEMRHSSEGLSPLNPPISQLFIDESKWDNKSGSTVDVSVPSSERKLPRMFCGDAYDIHSCVSDKERPYFAVDVKDLVAGRNFHTHVQTSGTVIFVKREKDGDIHLRIQNQGAEITAECIPELPCSIPSVSDFVTVLGISRFDGEHKWYEIHPVEALEHSLPVMPKQKP